MKKVVCLHNVYHDGRFITAGTDVGLPDDVARNWVERGLAKFVSEETPVNPPSVPPAQDNKEDAATSDGAEDFVRGSNAVTQESPTSSDISQDVPPDVPSEVKPEENSVVKQDFTTEQSNAVIKENLTTEKMAIEETPVNPPALNTEPPVVNAEVPPVEKPEANADLPPEVTPEGTGVVKFENDETPVSPNENSTTTTATDPAETPVADDDRPKRGRPPKKNGGKRK